MNEFNDEADWKRIGDIKPNDLISWWGQAAKVVSNQEAASGYDLTVYDQVEQKEKTFKYKKTDELIVIRQPI